MSSVSPILDIATGDGLCIEEHAWQGQRNLVNTRKDTAWPFQGCPTAQQWQV
jgi:hypothetical protein